jgi:hypothetical protein
VQIVGELMQRSVSELRRKLRLHCCPFCHAKQAWGKKATKSQIYDLLISTAKSITNHHILYTKILDFTSFFAERLNRHKNTVLRGIKRCFGFLKGLII